MTVSEKLTMLLCMLFTCFLPVQAADLTIISFGAA